MSVKLHAGVVTLVGTAMKFSVDDWKVCVAIKVLRRHVQGILTRAWIKPGRGLSEKETQWLGLFLRVFEVKTENKA